MRSLAVNLTLFKIGWLAVVFSAAASMPQVGVATIGIVVLIHLVRARRAYRESALLIIAGLTGLAWESLLVQQGALQYPTTSAELFAPYWIVAMWVLFATTLNVGMQWLRRNLWVAGIAGAIGGPLAFLAGEKAGAVIIGDNGLAFIAVGWALLLPLMARIAGQFNGYAEPRKLARIPTGESS